MSETLTKGAAPMNAKPGNAVVIDPITVEVIGSAFASIAEEMGEALVRASYSTNIKERRDCSTALFDTEGNTLCQAEHIPMHLGSFIGILPLTPVPSAAFTSEGGFRPVDDFAWSPAAEEQFNERLGRLLGGA